MGIGPEKRGSRVLVSWGTKQSSHDARVNSKQAAVATVNAVGNDARRG